MNAATETRTAPTSRTRPEHVETSDGQRWLMIPSDLVTEGHHWAACSVMPDQSSEAASWEMGSRGGVRWFVIDSQADGAERWSFRVVDDNWKVRREVLATGPTFAAAYDAVLAHDARGRRIDELNKRLRRARSEASKARIRAEIAAA